jgi:heme-degrading monooxygenase HmoA
VVICLYGLRGRRGADSQAEAELFEELLAKARSMPGFIGYHLYTSEDGEELGVIRFETREALDAWRDDPAHRASWQRAREFYTEFWVQNCETFRDYLWRDGRHVEDDLGDRFRSEPANLATTSPGASIDA